MRIQIPFLSALLAGLLATPALAIVHIGGGQTNVLLDTATLSSAAGLNVSGIGGPVIAPGDLGADSVAFPVNSRNVALPALATTFSYDPADFLGSFSGTIEHSGTVLFNADAVEVGNFTIAFDAARAGTLGGNASGFFVESTVGIQAILFDIENPTQLSPTDSSLTVAANLLVSPELGAFLLSQGLASTDLSGADVGDALVVAAVPEPSGIGLIACIIAGIPFIRRFNQ